MRVRKTNYDLSNCLNKTAMMRDILNGYKRIIEDPEREERFKKQECKICYYSGRMGGAAITTSECALCNEEMTFGNTNIDILCINCAKEKRVCKHCGADIEYKNRRKL